MHSTRSILAWSCTLALLSAPASAQIDVAICAAASTNIGACQYTDVQLILEASGRFGAVDILDAFASTPTLAQLQHYDAVIVWSNQNFADATLLGDTLADYVDAGGGVVVAVFANSTAAASRWLGGRWQNGYEVLLDQGGTTSTSPVSLGTVSVPGHPLMAGVLSLSGGSSSFRPTGTALASGATLVASWSDDKVLAAVGANLKRVDLGLYPPSSNCAPNFWDASTDGDVLLANALAFAANPSPCTGAVANYCTSSSTTHGCHPALSASGTPSASASSGFTLTCSSVEGLKSGLLFYGLSGPNAVPWAAGSTSFLCVKSPTQRTPTQSSGGVLNTCNGSMSIDLLAWLTANPGALGASAGAGQPFHVQAWFRDPPAPKTTNLSNGLTFVLCP